MFGAPKGTSKSEISFLIILENLPFYTGVSHLYVGTLDAALTDHGDKLTLQCLLGAMTGQVINPGLLTIYQSLPQRYGTDVSNFLPNSGRV